MVALSAVQKRQQTRLINKVIEIEKQYHDLKKRRESTLAELMASREPEFDDNKTYTYSAPKGRVQVTQVVRFSLRPDQAAELEGLLTESGLVASDFVREQTAYQLTPELHRILNQPRPHEKKLSESVDECVDKSVSKRVTIKPGQ